MLMDLEAARLVESLREIAQQVEESGAVSVSVYSGPDWLSMSWHDGLGCEQDTTHLASELRRQADRIEGAQVLQVEFSYQRGTRKEGKRTVFTGSRSVFARWDPGSRMEISHESQKTART